MNQSHTRAQVLEEDPPRRRTVFLRPYCVLGLDSEAASGSLMLAGGFVPGPCSLRAEGAHASKPRGAAGDAKSGGVLGSEVTEGQARRVRLR